MNQFTDFILRNAGNGGLVIAFLSFTFALWLAVSA